MYKLSKYSCSCLFLLIALWLTDAEAARSQRQQTAVAAAPAPYPSAEELKPDVPFEEGVSAAPDATYGPPDLIYGPPDEVYGPPETTIAQLPSAVDPQDFTPDPDAEEIQPADQAPAAPLIARRGRLNLARPQNLILLNQQAFRAPPAAAIAYVRPLRLLNAQQMPQLQSW